MAGADGRPRQGVDADQVRRARDARGRCSECKRRPISAVRRRVAVEERWNGSRLRLCRIASRRLYRVLGAEHIRHRRTAAPEVPLRRLLSLDYVLDHPLRPPSPSHGLTDRISIR